MAYQRIIHVVNRTTEPLECMDNGVPWTIKPGYKREQRVIPVKKGSNAAGDIIVEEMTEVIVGAGPGDTVYMEPLPYFVAERAKRQNPVMGTLDALNPNIFDSLIGVPDWQDDITPCEQSEAIELLDRETLGDRAKGAVVLVPRGAKKAPKMTKRERKLWQKRIGQRQAIVQQDLRNPAGIKVAYD
jgi:hypothetical protein